MKSTLGVCLIALTLSNVFAAQDPAVPVLRPGISVDLPVSSQATAMPEAEQQDATVVTITVDGNLYVGTRRLSWASLPA